MSNKNEIRGRVRGVAVAITIAMACLAALSNATAEQSAEPPPATSPSPEAILARYVEAVGGREACARVTNRLSKGTLEIPNQGITLELTVSQARPNRILVISESEMVGRIARGTDGETAWEITGMTGPRILKGAEKAEMLREAALDRLVRWRDYYESAEPGESGEVEGHPCDSVILQPKTGESQSICFDRETGLPAKVIATVEGPMGKVPVESYPSDYRSVDGLLVPFRTRANVLGQQRLITVSSVEHNVELSPDLFDVPVEVRELLEDRAEP
jgi:hypothetical protein